VIKERETKKGRIRRREKKYPTKNQNKRETREKRNKTKQRLE